MPDEEAAIYVQVWGRAKLSPCNNYNIKQKSLTTRLPKHWGSPLTAGPFTNPLCTPYRSRNTSRTELGFLIVYRSRDVWG